MILEITTDLVDQSKSLENKIHFLNFCTEHFLLCRCTCIFSEDFKQDANHQGQYSYIAIKEREQEQDLLGKI